MHCWLRRWLHHWLRRFFAHSLLFFLKYPLSSLLNFWLRHRRSFCCSARPKRIFLRSIHLARRAYGSD